MRKILCSICKQNRHTSEYSWRNKAKKVLHKHCKTCQRKITRLHYLRNKEVYKKTAKLWTHENKELRKAVCKERSAEYRGYIVCDCCTREEIRTFYMRCPKGCHVDRKITLSSDGKHCLKNLQYLSASEHGTKSCKERWSKNKK